MRRPPLWLGSALIAAAFALVRPGPAAALEDLTVTVAT